MEIAFALYEVPALKHRLQGCVAPEQPRGDCTAGWGGCSDASRCAAQERKLLLCHWGEVTLLSAHTRVPVPGQRHPQANWNAEQGWQEDAATVIPPAHCGGCSACRLGWLELLRIGTQTSAEQQVMLLGICVRCIFLINAPERHPCSLRLMCFTHKGEQLVMGLNAKVQKLWRAATVKCKKFSNCCQYHLYFSQYASFVSVSGISERRWSFKTLSHPRCPWDVRHHTKVHHGKKDETSPRQAAFGRTALAINLGSRTDFVRYCHFFSVRRSQEGCAHLLPLPLHLKCWWCGAWLCFLFFMRLCQARWREKFIWLWIEVV